MPVTLLIKNALLCTKLFQVFQHRYSAAAPSAATAYFAHSIFKKELPLNINNFFAEGLRRRRGSIFARTMIYEFHPQKNPFAWHGGGGDNIIWLKCAL
jgi:hypothetical protein